MSDMKTAAYFDGALTAMRRELRELDESYKRFGDGRWHQWADAVEYMTRLEAEVAELRRENARLQDASEGRAV